METIKDIRLATGMTQQQFSELLGVARSHLALAEGGHRQLSFDGIMKLEYMENHVNQKSAEMEIPYTNEHLEEVSKRLQSLKRNVGYRRFFLEEKLSKMEERLINNQKAYQLYMYCKENNLHGSDMLDDKIELAKSKIFANGKLYQEEVRAQLLLLSAEENSISQRLEKLSESNPYEHHFLIKQN